MKRTIKLFAVATVLALVTVACAGAENGGGGVDTPTSEEPQRGGTLRLALESDVSAAFDPQKEYYSVTWGYFRCCLTRMLMTYPGVPADEGGNDLTPDLADGEPEQSEDGLTWTFRIKDGVKFGPPVSEEIVAQDFIRALERTADPAASAGGYSFYYNVIEGFEEFAAGDADSISGLEAPDDKTLEITTKTPNGSLPFLMAMPAAAPIPDAVTKGHTKDYGRFLVSSGPYMFEGSEDLDFSKSPKDQEPVAGYRPGKSITLVRNPDWDPETDDLREAYVDRIETQIGGTSEDLFNKVTVGDLHMVPDSVPPTQVLREYQTDPERKDQVLSYPSDAVYYMSMNLAEPPFDDIHVRKAVNYALDKEGLIRLKGGPLFGSPANHIIVPSLVEDEMADFHPYSEDPAGDIEAAKEEMAQSKYDTDGDGVCDAPECKGILAANDEADPYPDYAALFEDNFSEIGLTFDTKSLERTTAYDKCLDPGAHTAFCPMAGWGKDFPDASTFAEPLFGSASLGPDACCNYSLVGADEDFLKEFDYASTDIPNVDDRIEECAEKTDEERIACWSEFDRYMMEEVVPWIPYLFQDDVFLIGADVVGFKYDQFSSQPAYENIGVSDAGEDA